jgi:hypothetical protein
MAETIQCTNCKKRFFSDGFKRNRFGNLNKTCLECAERRKNKKASAGRVPAALKQAILENSESDQFDVAKNEWDYSHSEFDDEETRCICGVAIIERCYIINRITASELLIGNVCVKNFINQEIGHHAETMSKSLKKIFKDPATRSRMFDLIEDALKKGYISNWDESFVISLQGTRKQLSMKQHEKLSEINNKILAAYSKKP